jgi:S-formylglutathione hydrolase FrmB
VVALLTCDFFSETLEVGTSMTVVLPQATAEQIGVQSVGTPQHGFPVLYLLHGLSDDHTAWLRYTSIERYATARGLAVVMPAVHRSFYADEAHGHAYWQFVSRELPEIVRSFFAVSHRREDTFVAGLSMGGYGALKLGFHHPERYAAVASLSGVVDIRALGTRLERPDLVQRVFGGRFTPDDDLLGLLDAADPATLPALYISCGTEEDMLMASNTRLAETARARGVDVTTDFRPGIHEWGLWDAVIQDVIAWLPRG